MHGSITGADESHPVGHLTHPNSVILYSRYKIIHDHAMDLLANDVRLSYTQIISFNARILQAIHACMILHDLATKGLQILHRLLW